MDKVGMDNSTRLYVASGMLTYGASADMGRTISYLRHMGVCSEVHHKERYIPQAELEGERPALLALCGLCSLLALLSACSVPAHLPACPPIAHRRASCGWRAELNSEQKALLDFIVLARAQRFVGFGSSTFSFYLREYRSLQV
jgi:hypothetical protein